MIRSLTTSHLVLAAVALLAGIVLGGVFPRGETQNLRERIAELEAQDCSPRDNQMGRQIVEAFRNRAASTPPPPVGSGPHRGISVVYRRTTRSRRRKSRRRV